MSLKSFRLIKSTLLWVKDDEKHTNSFNKYFGPVEENNDKIIEEEVKEEEEPEEEEEKEENANSSKEEGEADDYDKPDPWSPLSQKVRQDLKETYLKEVQQFLDRGKFQHYAENAVFNTLLPVSRRRLRRSYLEHLNGLTVSNTTHGIVNRFVFQSPTTPPAPCK